MRPAIRAPATRAAGTPTATWSGTRCGLSWWSRSPTTTRAAAASATARRSSAGARTRRRRTASSTSSSRRLAGWSPVDHLVGSHRVEDVRPDVDLPGGGDDQHRDGERHGDEGRREELIPLALSAGDGPRRQREEHGGQLEGGMGEGGEDEERDRDPEVPGDRRADEAEGDGLGEEREA